MSLINKTNVKRYTLGAVARLRPALAHKLTRVSGDIYEEAESKVRAFIDALVMSHPSIGKTITTGKRKEPDGTSC